MTTAEKRFYAYAQSIVDELDPTDVICIFKNKNWEMAGTYTNTYYVIYYDDNFNENEKSSAFEFGDLDEALDFVVPEAGISLRNILQQVNFDLVMVPSINADMKLLY